MSGTQEMIASEQSESGKKHLVLEVPNHASQASGETRPMTTFLRMGTFDPNARGMSLLEEAESFVDDTRDRGNNPAGFPAGAPGHKLTAAERAAETSKLRTRGGWQDHSDGNRLSTTMGDKLEIVRGNYKLLVLGRQDDQSNAAGWDVSGGKIEDSDPWPPSYTEWKWVQKWDGTWKLTQMIEKSEVHEITHGNLKEEFYGDRIESIIGAELHGTKVDHATKSFKNQPEIVEKTWAKSITSDTGSLAAPVPTIIETTHAKSMEDATFVTTAKSTTTVATRSESKTLGTSADIIDETGAAGSPVKTISSKTYAGATSEVTAVGAASVNSTFGALHEAQAIGHYQSFGAFGSSQTLQTFGSRSEVAFCGANFSFTAAVVMLDIEYSLIRGEVKAGGAFFEIEAGAFYLELFLGLKMEVSLAGEVKGALFSKDLTLEKAIGIGL